MEEKITIKIPTSDQMIGIEQKMSVKSEKFFKPGIVFEYKYVYVFSQVSYCKYPNI